MINKIRLLYNTVKYLKPTQVFHQLKYRLKKAGALAEYDKGFGNEAVNFLSFKKTPPVYNSYKGNNEFSFLNLDVTFGAEIDWDYQDHGKLWNYNLQYCNYLLQEEVPFTTKEELILSLYGWLDNGKLAVEPYPASLRIINVLRLYSKEQKENKTIFSYVHAELDFLSQRPEYHLLGNHLLENAFALMMGGAFFSNNKWWHLGREILRDQLSEQILPDGAHFELSPMYHQIIFFRLLELADWYSNFEEREGHFLEYLIGKLQLMQSWLKHMTFANDDIPHFNDSANGISYSTDWLLKYADDLNINHSEVALSASGYRIFNKGAYECRVDCGQVGPSYQPGHAHADALSYILYYNNEPLFVERGTSTYQIGNVRSIERSSSSHNTVVVNDTNQSNVWSGFRVAERAKIKITGESLTSLSGEHDGYNKLGIIHKRTFTFEDDSIHIQDELRGNDSAKKEFHIHLYPGLTCTVEGGRLFISNDVSLSFKGAEDIRIENYDMADGYNRYKVGKKAIVTFKADLGTTIILNNI